MEATAIKTRPIIFSGPMAKAILQGRKTQTRRVVTVPWHKGKRCPPYGPHWDVSEGKLYGMDEYGEFHEKDGPYGQPGDRLWVRETWRPVGWTEEGQVRPQYQADMEMGIYGDLYLEDDDADGEKYNNWWIKLGDALDAAGCKMDSEDRYQNVEEFIKWRPSILMPKTMARIWLEVKIVRVERVQDISEDDAMAEGITTDILPACGDHPDLQCYVTMPDDNHAYPTAQEAFEKLWNSINKKRGFGWDVNPWVWVVEFEKVKWDSVIFKE